MNKIDRPISIPIKKIEEENSTTKTFYFDFNLKAKPGQFIMLWIPGIDQKPFGVAWQNDDSFAVTVCNVGPATAELFKFKVGDLLGIQGPYGTNYKIGETKNLALVAGGYGVGPLSFLADQYPELQIDFIVGAQTENKLLFIDKLKNRPNINLHACTDDGSCGYKGYTTDKLAEIVEEKKIDLVCTCGPELMQEKIIELCGNNDIPCQISMERYIKCGIGVCGQCTVDPLGIRMCVEGPVISAKLVKQIYEFGQYHRDASGVKHYFKK